MAWGRKSGEPGGQAGSETVEDLAMAARVELTRRSQGAGPAIQMAEEELAKAADSHPARVALALALMDLDRVDEARHQLLRYLDSALAESPETDATADAARVSEPDPSALSRELSASWAGESAFPANPLPSSRESDPAQVSTGRRPQAGARGDFPFGATSSFATQTMAGLLDRQGDHKRADVIRESLDERMVLPPKREERPAERPESGEDQRVVQTLEAWLRNLERERA